MAVSACKAVWEHSPATGNARLVELYLADCVNEKSFRRGHPPIAWASQRTLAERCRCSRSTVQDALEELQELGRIIDTGKRKQRGTVVWELHLTDDRSSRDSDRTGNRSSEGADWTENRSSRDDWTDDRSSGAGDWTDSAGDWTDSREDRTENRSGTGPRIGHKPEGNQELKPEYEPDPRDVGAARDPINRQAGEGNSHDTHAGQPLSPAAEGQAERRRRAIAERRAEERREDECELARLEEQEATSRHPEKTRKAIEELRSRLASAPAEAIA